MIFYLKSLVLVVMIMSCVDFTNSSFYITNGASIEQCSTGSNSYFARFKSSQMRCLEKSWRHISMAMRHSCNSNSLKNSWYLKTELKGTSAWPTRISMITNYNINATIATWHTSNINLADQTIDETPISFNANYNSLIAYIWIDRMGPYCRIKYSVSKDICTKKAGQKIDTTGLKFVHLKC